MSDYRDHVLARDPLLYWRLHDAAGPVADWTGNGRSGALGGAWNFKEPGLFPGSQFNMGADTDGAKIQGSAVPIPTGVDDKYGVELVLKVLDPTATQRILELPESTMLTVNNGDINLYVWTGSGFGLGRSWPIAANTTHLISYSFSRASHARTLYVDTDDRGGSSSGDAGEPSSTPQPQIGGSASGSHLLAGTEISDVSIWDLGVGGRIGPDHDARFALMANADDGATFEPASGRRPRLHHLAGR